MSKAIFWFRQDLRLIDNPGLFHACQNHDEILYLYILDDEHLCQKAQAWWLHHSLTSLQKKIQLVLKRGAPEDILNTLILEHDITAVYWNRCYEPQHIQRDQQIKSHLKNNGIQVQSFNASLLHEPWEVKTQQGHYFKVFTPYWKQCLKQMPVKDEKNILSLPKPIACASDSLEAWQLLPTTPNWAKSFSDYWQPGEEGAAVKLNHFLEKSISIYKDGRNQPALKATSSLSPHLHFGEIGPWQIYRAVATYQSTHTKDHSQSDCFLSEIGWREFSYHLLYHFPTLSHENFKAQFNQFPWHQNQEAFQRWSKGLTGYPIVDAGMRELWHTGTMHNRVRMIVASFLVKDLFIDWREGAQWFLQTLLDADLASNSAGWQWVAGSGADAAPYFRIFNPILQGEKFDPKGIYVRTWVPELENVDNKWIHQPWNSPNKLEINYPKPMVDHSEARNLALAYYQSLK